MAERLPVRASARSAPVHSARSRSSRSGRRAARLNKEGCRASRHQHQERITEVVARQRTLTRLPDAFGCWQGVTEDALVPEAAEPVDHFASPVQDDTLHLVFTVV